MKAYLQFLLLFTLSTSITNAQIGPAPIGTEKPLTKQTLVETFKIKGFTYKVFESIVSEKDNGSYDTGEKGNDFYLYLVYKGRLLEQAKFAKEIKNSTNKISREGSYKVNGDSIEILKSHYTYYFGSASTLVIFVPTKTGVLDLISEKDIKIDSDKLSNDYVKDAGIASPVEP